MRKHVGDVDSARWNAVQRRDPIADGSFVYAVRTTKIYCRPVCKARLARRANISFYINAQGAEDAGYRSCKRCRPEVAGLMPEERAVRRVRSMVERELVSPTPVVEGEEARPHNRTLARRARVSKWHFHRTFKEITGLTPVEYKRRQGIERSGPPASETSGCGGVAGPRDTDTSDNLLHSHFDANMIDWASLSDTDWLDDLRGPCLFDELPYDSEIQSFNTWMNQLDLSVDPHFFTSNDGYEGY